MTIKPPHLITTFLLCIYYVFVMKTNDKLKVTKNDQKLWCQRMKDSISKDYIKHIENYIRKESTL